MNTLNINSSINFNKTTKITLQEDLLIVSIVKDDQEDIDQEILKEYSEKNIYNVLFVLSSQNKKLIYKFDNDSIPFIIKDGDHNEKLLKAFEYSNDCGYKYVVEFDLDMQYNILEIPNLHKKAIEGYDLIVGDRLGNSSFKNTKSNKNLANIFKLKLVNIKDPYCYFRLFNWNVINFYLNNRKITIEPYSYCVLRKKERIKTFSLPVRIRKNINSWVDKKNNKFSFFIKQVFKSLF